MTPTAHCRQFTQCAPTAKALTWGATLASLLITPTQTLAQEDLRQPTTLQEAEQMMFGKPEDIAFAELLWQVMAADRLVGPEAIRSIPYQGLPPHGVMLEVFFTKATVAGREGELIVKRNFGPGDVTIEQVIANPEAHLQEITIMFRREAGWDAEMQDWFWADYNPDGSLTLTPQETVNAGAVGKNLDRGCISCHIAAAGNDFVFTAEYPIR